MQNTSSTQASIFFRTELLYYKFRSLFPQEIIQDAYTFHWNLIHKSLEVTWNVGPYKLIWLSSVEEENMPLKTLSVPLGTNVQGPLYFTIQTFIITEARK